MNDSIAQAYLKEMVIHQSISEPLFEEVHPDIITAMNSNANKHNKFNQITKSVRGLIKNGQDTGLVDDKPKKGSSRAVLFPKDDHVAVVDGITTKIPHVLKIAFSGDLDKHLPMEHPLLGQMQNQHEIDVSNNGYSILKKVGDNHYETTPDGFLPPMLDHHANGHWMQVGKITPIDAKNFKKATKNPDFPNGITHSEFYGAVAHHWEASQGRTAPSWLVAMSPARLEKVSQHPLVDRTIRFSLDTDTIPFDFNQDNMGIWEHPITKQKHIVASDAGFSKTVMKAYQEARKNEAQSNAGE